MLVRDGLIAAIGAGHWRRSSGRRSSTARWGAAARARRRPRPPRLDAARSAVPAAHGRARRSPGWSTTTGATGARPRRASLRARRGRSGRRSPPGRRSCAATSRWTPTASSNVSTACSPPGRRTPADAGWSWSPSRSPASSAIAGPPISSTRPIRAGADLVGGIDPCAFDRDPVAHLDAVFGLAERHQVGVDIHLHEAGELGAFTFELIAERVAALGMARPGHRQPRLRPLVGRRTPGRRR